MTDNEAILILKRSRIQNVSDDDFELAFEMALKALKFKEDITKIINGQLIAGKNNYKEIYSCFYEVVKVVQDNY